MAEQVLHLLFQEVLLLMLAEEEGVMIVLLQQVLAVQVAEVRAILELLQELELTELQIEAAAVAVEVGIKVVTNLLVVLVVQVLSSSVMFQPILAELQVVP
jgi:hypothetical protein